MENRPHAYRGVHDLNDVRIIRILPSARKETEEDNRSFPHGRYQITAIVSPEVQSLALEVDLAPDREIRIEVHQVAVPASDENAAFTGRLKLVNYIAQFRRSCQYPVLAVNAHHLPFGSVFLLFRMLDVCPVPKPEPKKESLWGISGTVDFRDYLIERSAWLELADHFQASYVSCHQYQPVSIWPVFGSL